MSGDGVVVPLHGDGGDPRTRRHSERHPSARRRADVLEFGDPAAPAALPADLSDAADSAHPADPATPAGKSARSLAGFARRRLEGAFEIDEFGFDRELTDALVLPAFRALYRRWFRVEVNGIENLPDTGGALLVANHAGGLWPLDAIMTAVAVHDEHPRHRYLRPLGNDLLLGAPGVGPLARRSGATLACRADADRLLAAGELVGVWPEGFAGIGKPFKDRYELQRFGRGGFLRSAVTAGVPVIPVSIVGAEEIHPVLGRSRSLARVLGLPYVPLTPTFPWLGPLGLVPLPSKWYLEFGAPIGTAGLADDRSAVSELTDHVRESIQSTLHRLVRQRRSVWR